MFDVIISRSSIVYLWLLVQSAINTEVSVWIYGHYILDILNILNDGISPLEDVSVLF